MHSTASHYHSSHPPATATSTASRHSCLAARGRQACSSTRHLGGPGLLGVGCAGGGGGLGGLALAGACGGLHHIVHGGGAAVTSWQRLGGCLRKEGHTNTLTRLSRDRPAPRHAQKTGNRARQTGHAAHHDSALLDHHSVLVHLHRGRLLDASRLGVLGGLVQRLLHLLLGQCLDEGRWCSTSPVSAQPLRSEDIAMQASRPCSAVKTVEARSASHARRWGQLTTLSSAASSSSLAAGSSLPAPKSPSSSAYAREGDGCMLGAAVVHRATDQERLLAMQCNTHPRCRVGPASRCTGQRSAQQQAHSQLAFIAHLKHTRHPLADGRDGGLL